MEKWAWSVAAGTIFVVRPFCIAFCIAGCCQSCRKTSFFFSVNGACRQLVTARKAIFEYVEVFYNRLRRHASLGYLTPEEFKKHYFQEKQLEAEGSQGSPKPSETLPY